MRPGADAPAAIRLSPGGQGANVAVRLARRGARVRLITGLADDATGRFLREAVEAEGVELAAMPVAASGSVLVMLDADGERTMLSDRTPFVIDRLPDLIADAGWIHVSGYALRDANGATLAQALSHRPTSVRLSIGGGSVPPGRGAESLRQLVVVADPDLLILNDDEASALAPPLPGALTIVTAGAAGSSATGPGFDRIDVVAPILDRPIVDSTGAGDAYAAEVIDQLIQLADWPPTIDSLRGAMEVASAVGAALARIPGAQGPLRH